MPSEEEMFEMFDADEDGLLTLDEVMNGLENMDEEIPTLKRLLKKAILIILAVFHGMNLLNFGTQMKMKMIQKTITSTTHLL